MNFQADVTIDGRSCNPVWKVQDNANADPLSILVFQLSNQTPCYDELFRDIQGAKSWTNLPFSNKIRRVKTCFVLAFNFGSKNPLVKCQPYRRFFLNQIAQQMPGLSGKQVLQTLPETAEVGQTVPGRHLVSNPKRSP